MTGGQVHTSGSSVAFEVLVDGERVDDARWPGRRAAELVQLLALADEHRLLRDQVIEALWPHLDADAGGANLRKAAHHARRALGDPEAVTLHRGEVVLFPARDACSTDVATFEAAADDALAADDVDAARERRSTSYPGDLLPDVALRRLDPAHRDRLSGPPRRSPAAGAGGGSD